MHTSQCEIFFLNNHRDVQVNPLLPVSYLQIHQVTHLIWVLKSAPKQLAVGHVYMLPRIPTHV